MAITCNSNSGLLCKVNTFGAQWNTLLEEQCNPPSSLARLEVSMRVQSKLKKDFGFCLLPLCQFWVKSNIGCVSWDKLMFWFLMKLCFLQTKRILTTLLVFWLSRTLISNKIECHLTFQFLISPSLPYLSVIQLAHCKTRINKKIII